jgi:hypothetical protein
MSLSYNIDVYFRCAEDGCVFNMKEDFYSTDLTELGILELFFDSERSDILWHSTQSYDEALVYYLKKLPNPSRELKENGLEDTWPISEPLYFKYDDKEQITVEKLILIFEELAFGYSVPVCFPDLKSLSEVSDEEFNENLQNYL